MRSQFFAASTKNYLSSTVGYGRASVTATTPSTIYGTSDLYMCLYTFGSGHNSLPPTLYTPLVSQYEVVRVSGINITLAHRSRKFLTPVTYAAVGVPTLVTPRGQSTLHTEKVQPATFPRADSQRRAQGRRGIMNRSMTDAFSSIASLPTSTIGPDSVSTVEQAPAIEYLPHIKLLAFQDPPIPRAIALPTFPRTALDRALESARGETDVYIRGLLPETTDDKLKAWGSRFGKIQSSKAMLDSETGLCKRSVCR